MAKYLNPELVCRAFKRLSSRKKIGKSHKERTSILMIFLSIDAACKHFGVKSLDLNPDSLDGKNNRKQVEIEFVRLVLLESTLNNLKQVTEMGKIDVDSYSPEKRISSNFYTVPLKKASEQLEPFFYPRRPPAPLLKMGHAATGKKWGIQHHDDWSLNFPLLFSEIKEPTPLLDLAIFVCRDCHWDDGTVDVISAVCDQIKKRFTKELSEYWTSKIDKEKIMARHLDSPFIDHHALFLNSFAGEAPTVKPYERMNKPELVERIQFLEALLSANNVTY